MKQKYTAILLDLDGLLIDSEKIYHEVGYWMTDQLGKVLTKDIIAKQMGRRPYESLDIYRRQLGITSHSTQELVEWRDELMIEADKKEIKLMPGARELIDQAYGNYKLAIATGSTQNLVDIVVDKLNLGPKMQHIQASDGLNNGKPHPEIFLECAKHINEDQKNCIVLEDSSNGCVAGKRAGCFVIAVPNEFTEHQEFLSADIIVGDLFEAWKKIKELT